MTPYKARPFSLRGLTRVYEIDEGGVVRSRPSSLAFWSAEDHGEHLSDITVRSTGNSLRGDVVILKDGQEVFTWKNVFRPLAKKKMLEELSRQAKAAQVAAPMTVREETTPPAASQEERRELGTEPTRKHIPGPGGLRGTNS